MAAVRTERLAALYRKQIHEIITRELSDELDAMITVTEVDVSPDIKHAKVYLSVFSPDEKKAEAAFSLVSSRAGMIRRSLAAISTARTVPELHFMLDTSMQYSEKINKLLEEIK